MDRVLLLAAKTAYQTDDFAQAAQRLGVDVVLGWDRCKTLAKGWSEDAIALDFRRPEQAAREVVERAGRVTGIVATDERTALIAAIAAERLGLPYNPVTAARATSDKLVLRQRLATAGVAQPAFREVPLDADIAAVAASLRYPVVVKPRQLSTSRGVMRADDADELAERFERLRRLLRDPDIVTRDDREGAAPRSALIEEFVPGAEVAFEGLVSGGRLRALALFDKPEPLDGPFFAETIYVTPSMLPAETQAAVVRCVGDAAAAIELVEGPVHAELRLGPRGPVVIEVAARSIGGLCARSLQFGAGLALEELIIAHAVRRDVGEPARAGAATGVLMLPVPAAGVYRGVEGDAAARAIAGVRELTLTVRAGEDVVPLPEGNKYLGFVFAAADRPADVVAALQAARAELRFDIRAKL